jgi:dTDP-4-amino-4,6-dideoxy-D-galactose acyltransferase
LIDQDSVCEQLEWDSSFFGQNIGRITKNQLTESTAAEARAWCERQRIDCLYFLAEASDSASVRAAEDGGFRLVDIRLTFERELSATPSKRLSDGIIRMGDPSDSSALIAIAGQCHRDSRFYQDPHFPRSRCDALYETWIEKSLNGYAEAVLVAQWKGEAVGYISCHLRSSSTGQIGLFGIKASARGFGLGQDLINESLRWFGQNDVSRVSVVSQGRNATAQRVYQRCGFLTHAVQLWFHYWSPR